MPKAIIVRQTGGPEVLKLENIAEPREPGPGQVLLRHTAIGANYMDIYYRSGMYKAPRLPMVPGMEAAGIVEKCGKGVKITPGTRVVYGTSQTGAYCEKRLINAKHLIGIPDFITDEVAAACFARALTAHYLIFRTYIVKKNDTILVHAAAGGVGQMICQWTKHKGAKVIGVVSIPEKANIALANGCDYVIVSSQQDVVAEVKRITGEGVPVVYDSVGKDTFSKSLACLRPFGILVSFGQSSGPVPPINILNLAPKCNFITRPTLMMYKANRAELVLTAVEIFQMIESGKLKINIGQRFPLEQAAKAHTAIQSRQTIGSTILTV